MNTVESLKPFPENGVVYGIISGVDHQEHEVVVNMDLLNKHMLNLDKNLINNPPKITDTDASTFYEYFATLKLTKKDYHDIFANQTNGGVGIYNIKVKTEPIVANAIPCAIHFSSNFNSESREYLIELIKTAPNKRPTL